MSMQPPGASLRLLMGREITNIRSRDMLIIAGGRTGTLGEFAIAYDEGRLVGVLMGTGDHHCAARVLRVGRTPSPACRTTTIRRSGSRS